MGKIIELGSRKEFDLKHDLRSKIIAVLEEAELTERKVYLNTLYVALGNISRDRSLINEVVEELRDEGTIHQNTHFTPIVLTGKRPGRW